MANKTQNAVVNDPEQAAVTNDELLALHTAQGEVIAEQDVKIAELTKKLEAALAAKPEAKVSAGTVQAGAYRVVHGVFVDGALKSPADIAADAALLDRLVSEGSSAVQPA